MRVHARGGGEWNDNPYFSVVKATRRLADVSKDPGFAESGVFRHSFLGLKVTDINATEASRAKAVRELSDKSILLAGEKNAGLFMMKLTAGGTLDPSFSSGGIATPTLPNASADGLSQVSIAADGSVLWPLHLVRDPDGRAHVASARVEPAANLSSTNFKYKIVRLDNDGKIDAAFAPIERSVYVIAGNNIFAEPYALLFDDFGKMVSFFPRASGYDVRPEN